MYMLENKDINMDRPRFHLKKEKEEYSKSPPFSNK